MKTSIKIAIFSLIMLLGAYTVFGAYSQVYNALTGKLDFVNFIASPTSGLIFSDLNWSGNETGEAIIAINFTGSDSPPNSSDYMWYYDGNNYLDGDFSQKIQGNMTADTYYGDGSQLTGISVPSLSADNNYLENDSTTMYWNESKGNETYTTTTAIVNQNMSHFNVTNIDAIIGDGNNVKIGTGVDTHSLTSATDLYVTGKLEVDGSSYMDGITYFYNHNSMMDDFGIYSGTGSDTRVEYDTAQTPDSWLFGTSTDSNGMVICEQTDINTDFAHPLQVNPTVYLQGYTGVSNWSSLAYNADEQKFIIDTDVSAVDTTVAPKLTAHNTLYAEDDVYIGDATNYELYSVQVNGTDVVMTSPQSLPYVFKNSDVVVDKNVTVTENAGTGNGFACFDENGKLYRSGVACV